MAVYRTCSDCLFREGPCAERTKLSQRIKGLGLTSVKFKCDWKRAEFRPGEAITVSVLDSHADYGEDGYRCELVDGFFVSDTSAPTKVLVYVSPAAAAEAFDGEIQLRNNGYMRLSRQHVTRRAGVPASFCKDCGNLSDISGHCEWCKHHPDAEKIAKELWGTW